MFILELTQQVECETPKGKARIWLVTEYGMGIEKLFTVIVRDTREIWEFTNRDVKICQNITFDGEKRVGGT